MGAIQTFSVRLKTSDRNKARTNGDVYIGLCGREFYIDSKDPDFNDFEQGAEKTYVFGDGNNIRYHSWNDPRYDYPINTEDIELTPAYIRFGPEDGDDEWNLESVTVDVNNGEVQLEALVGGDNLWLSTHSGMYCYLWTSTKARARAKLR